MISKLLSASKNYFPTSSLLYHSLAKLLTPVKDFKTIKETNKQNMNNSKVYINVLS